MKLIYLLLGILILASCGVSDTNTNTNNTSESKIAKSSPKNKSVKFLWRDMKFDSTLNDTFNSIFINKDYLDIMTEPEKAALGYVATFIGNECWWDDKANDDRSNLDCKIITALGLGYQCSEKHLGFLRKWFTRDKQIMSELESSNCPTIPFTATSQTTFEEINLTTKNDTIIVAYKASGVNVREQATWEWSESDYFLVAAGGLSLIKKDESKVKHGTFGMTEGK